MRDKVAGEDQGDDLLFNDTIRSAHEYKLLLSFLLISMLFERAVCE
jgi:hypothetical protein